MLLISLSITVGCSSLPLTQRYSKDSNTTAPCSSTTSDIFTRTEMSFEDYIDNCDLIVEGKVIGDNVQTYVGFALTDFEKQNGAKMPNPDFPVTRVEVEVSKVIYGELSEKTIVFSQLGWNDTDFGHKKVKKGDKVILLLKKYENEEIYSSVSLNNGVFLYNEDTIDTYSEKTDIKKYKEMKKDDFIKDLEKQLKKLGKKQ